jgi:hypothetical protein
VTKSDHVEEEDPAPAEQVGERRADQWSRSVADPRRAEDEAHGEAGALVRERRIGHPEDRGPHQRPADSHQDPHRDQPGLALSRSAKSRERGEDRAADEEGTAAAEEVGEAAAGDDQDAEDEGVGVHHPLSGGDVGLEVLLDLRGGAP